MLAANGGVLFLDKVSPALEQVDSSLGVLGTVVDRLHYDDLEDNPQAYRESLRGLRRNPHLTYRS